MRLAKGDARRRPSPLSPGRSCTTCAGGLEGAREGGGGAPWGGRGSGRCRGGLRRLGGCNRGGLQRLGGCNRGGLRRLDGGGWGSLGGGRSRDVHRLPFFSNEGDGGADLGHVAGGHQNLKKHAVVVDLHLEVRLVRLHLGDGVSGLDLVPSFFSHLRIFPPSSSGKAPEAGFQWPWGFLQPSSRYRTFFTAATIRAGFTSAACSSTAA